MIRDVQLVIGKARVERAQTRRIVRVVVNGEKRGRLSLTFGEASQLAERLQSRGGLVVEDERVEVR